MDFRESVGMSKEITGLRRHGEEHRRAVLAMVIDPASIERALTIPLLIPKVETAVRVLTVPSSVFRAPLPDRRSRLRRGKGDAYRAAARFNVL